MVHREVLLCRALELGSDPGEVEVKVDEVYRRVDRAVALGSKALALPCRRGCSACCHESVFLSAPEFLKVILHLWRQWSPEAIAELVSSMRRLAEELQDDLELLEILESGAERNEVARRVRFRCPFLTSDESCSIHQVRELNARTFGQSVDGASGQPYGCELTHQRLPVVPATLADARQARRWMAEAFPSSVIVQVYPWWFARFGHLVATDP